MSEIDSPVVIIGAGLAGLACAITLQQKGLPILIFEKSNEVGGRLKTSKTDESFLLDHGFQVLLTSYPELKNFLDLKSLELQNFNSGALLYTPEKIRLLANPILHPSQLLNETLSDLVSLKDKALVVKLILNLRTSSTELESSVSTLYFLKNFGFSDDFIELFWRPFCAGVFLDKDLEVASDYFIFLLKNFSVGRVAVPRNGMQEIPLQMSRKIGSANIRLGVEIEDIKATEVRLANGELIKARAVVCAFDQSEKPARLEKESNQHRSVINYYFSTSKSLEWKKWLLLVPPQYGFNVNNVSVMSDVSLSYSSNGENLLSASIIGQSDPGEDVVAKELEKIAGFDLNLKFIKKFIISKALPKKINYEHTRIENGLYSCGDHLGGPSINGALRSGRLTAEKISALFETR